MLAYVLAFFLGLGVSFGPLSFLSTPFSTLAGILVSYTQILADYAVKNITSIPETSKLMYFVIPLIAISLPSFVSLFVVLLATAVNSIKKIITLFGVLIALSSYFFLPWLEATFILIASVILATLVNFVGGPLLTIPMVAFSTATGLSIAREVFKGENNNINKAVEIFSKAQPSTDPLIWKYALAFAALAPLVGIVGIIFNNGKETKKNN